MSDHRGLQLDPARVRLKLASKALVKAVGGTDVAGEIAAVRQQRVSDCTLPNTGDFLRISEALAIEEFAPRSGDWPQVTRAMARQNGFALLPLPQCGVGDTEWHKAIGEVSREVGEAVGSVCDALHDDDRVSAAEIKEKRIVEEIDRAIDGLVRMRALAVAELERESRK